ncbi:Hypothetical Protein FCC1311_111672 [Hondaea fermentalgiana]|uniref:Uncharacterized protein n=1 Tax=Hondaea fermentalgiana TaxID=2315210 RepID=A0A2R5H3F3_9STRA|nr:Hypothetical Protein FCC1311_111672 [Hondaea fermentalgiana]|eukprot:GBG34944.1 Hypothetical Protein FCC1311_111672 [Hondaea fermentalgiana]
MITNTAGMRNAIAEWSGTVGVETSQAHVNNAPRKKKMNARPPAPCKNAARARAEKARLAVKEWSGTVGVASSSDNANDVPSKTNTYAEHKSVIRRKGSLLGNARSARLALAEWSGVVGIGNDEDELDVDIPKTCRSSGYSTSSISTISSVSSCGSSDASTIDDFVYTTSTQRPPVNKHTSTKSSGPMRNVRLAFAEWSDTVGVGMAEDNDDDNDAAAAAPAAHKATKAKSPSRSKSLRLALAEWSGTVRVSLDTDEEQHETSETRTTDTGSSQTTSRPEVRKTKSARHCCGMQLVLVTLRAVATVFVVQAFGVALVRAGILTRDVISGLSSLVQNFLLPASIFVRMGGIMTMELLREMWLLPVVYLLMILANLLVAYTLLLPLSGSPDWFRPWFTLTVSFPNMVAIPLIFVREICQQVTFVEDGVALDANECLAQGELFLFFAGQLVTLSFWIIGPEMVAQHDAAAPAGIELTSQTVNNRANGSKAAYTRVACEEDLEEVSLADRAKSTSRGANVQAAADAEADDQEHKNTPPAADLDSSNINRRGDLHDNLAALEKDLGGSDCDDHQNSNTENSLMIAVMFMSVCTPTSNNSVVLLTMSKQPDAADALALVIMGQYIVGMFSMTAFLVLSFRHLDI